MPLTDPFPRPEDIDHDTQTTPATRVVLATALALSPALPAPARSGFSWHDDRTIAANPSQTALSVTYGMPQTDAFQFNARCLLSGGGSQVEVFLAAPVTGLPSGTEVQVRVQGNRRYQQVLNAVVLNDSEGQPGIRFYVGADSAFLAAVRDEGSLTYGVFGQPSTDLSLRGSGRHADAFINDCAQIARLRPGQQTVSSQGQFAGNGCESIGQLRSQHSNNPTNIVFVNQSNGYRVVYWLDFNGTPVQYGALQRGEQLAISSYMTHPWMITDGPGNCVEVVFLLDGLQVYPLTARGGSFGDE